MFNRLMAVLTVLMSVGAGVAQAENVFTDMKLAKPQRVYYCMTKDAVVELLDDSVVDVEALRGRFDTLKGRQFNGESLCGVLKELTGGFSNTKTEATDGRLEITSGDIVDYYIYSVVDIDGATYYVAIVEIPAGEGPYEPVGTSLHP